MKLGGVSMKLGGVSMKLGGVSMKLGGVSMKLGSTRGSLIPVGIMVHPHIHEGSWIHG
jgi:hypothetical protein